MKINLFHYLVLVFAISYIPLQAQAPLISFQDPAKKSLQEIQTALKENLIVTPIDQQKQALGDLLLQEGMSYWHYQVFASAFFSVFEEKHFKKATELWPDYGGLSLDSSITEGEFSTVLWDEIIVNSFAALDFDKDGRADLFFIPQVFFGPSPGIAVYGYENGTLKCFFSIAGMITQFEKNTERVILRYQAMIIDSPETEILHTIVYDFKKKSSRLDNKLYYATQTLIPTKLSKPQAFVCKDSVIVRTDKTVNDSIYSEEYSYEKGGSKTLRGNVIAVYPKGAEGYVLAQSKAHSFVVFSPNATFNGCSLAHGMEQVYLGDDPETGDPIFKIPVKPYICGWVEKKKLQLK